MSFSLYILNQAERDCDNLPKKTYTRCYLAMQKLIQNPRAHGSQKLVGEEGHRIRVGDYRILYRIDDALKRIYIYRIKHRKEAYR